MPAPIAAETRAVRTVIPVKMAEWLDREAARKYPRVGVGGNVSALVREILERERRRVERRAR